MMCDNTNLTATQPSLFPFDTPLNIFCSFESVHSVSYFLDNILYACINRNLYNISINFVSTTHLNVRVLEGHFVGTIARWSSRRSGIKRGIPKNWRSIPGEGDLLLPLLSSSGHGRWWLGMPLLLEVVVTCRLRRRLWMVMMMVRMSSRRGRVMRRRRHTSWHGCIRKSSL